MYVYQLYVGKLWYKFLFEKSKCPDTVNMYIQQQQHKTIF